jgi:hypothetical protein
MINNSSEVGGCLNESLKLLAPCGKSKLWEKFTKGQNLGRTWA